MQDLARLIEPANQSAGRVTAALYQASGAISTGTQLPIAIEVVKPFELWRKLQQFDPQILRGGHVKELGYSTYAVVEVLSGAIAYRVNELSRLIEELVGVTSFGIVIDQADEDVG